MHRRSCVFGLSAAAASALLPSFGATPVNAQSNSKYFSGTTTDGGVQFRGTNFNAVPKKWRRQMVKYFSDEPKGTVVIDTRHHYLYLIWENNTALRYGVGVGKEGFQWFGRANVALKRRWPRWVPPDEMRERNPNLPEKMEGGLKAALEQAQAGGFVGT